MLHHATPVWESDKSGTLWGRKCVEGKNGKAHELKKYCFKHDGGAAAYAWTATNGTNRPWFINVTDYRGGGLMYLDVKMYRPTFSQLPITVKRVQRTSEQESPRTKLQGFQTKWLQAEKNAWITLLINVELDKAAVLASLAHFQLIAVV